MNDALTKPIIAILGIGGSKSIGYTMTRDIVRDTDLMESIDGLLLNDGDDVFGTGKRDHVDSHINSILRPLTVAIKKRHYINKIHYDTQENIAKKAAMTYVCIDKYQKQSGTLFWEPDNRKKFFKYNYPQIVNIAKKYSGAPGQCVVVTNPSLNMARAFQTASGLGDGQVLAYNPDNLRFLLKLMSNEITHPDIINYYDKVFLVGDHGSTADAISLDDSFFSLVGEQNVKELVRLALEEGKEVSYEHQGVSGNIVPDMVTFIRSAVIDEERKNKPVFVLGTKYSGVYCSLPIVNEQVGSRDSGIVDAETGRKIIVPLYRARIADVIEPKKSGNA